MARLHGRMRRMGGCITTNFGQQFAGGQLAFAAPDRKQFDPSVNVEAEQWGIIARTVGNFPTLTYVLAGQ